MAMPHTQLGMGVLDVGPCIHRAGDAAPSPALLAYTLPTSARCRGAQRSLQAWWAVPVPQLPGPLGREQLQPAPAMLGAMGGGGAMLGKDRACSWQRAQLEQMFSRRTQGPHLRI